MRKQKKNKKDTPYKILLKGSGSYIKTNAVKLISFIVLFAALALLSFFRVSASTTVSNYKIEDYEVGQVSDITIYADKTLQADSKNPVSVEKGEKVIKKGFVITEDAYAKLKRMSESKAYIDYRSFANTILYLMLASALYFFLFSEVCLGKKCEEKEYITVNIFFIMIFASAVFSSRTLLFRSPFSMNIILPSVFCTFFVAILFGQLDAICFSIVSAFLVLCAAGYNIVPFLFCLCSCLSASRIVRRLERREHLMYASALQGLLEAMFILVLKIVFNEPVTHSAFLAGCMFFNGLLSGILFLGFLTPIEMILNTATVFRLRELCDNNVPILRELQNKASGTYQHSYMVAQLAEKACADIGANRSLAYAGGYYHDIGKIDSPECFTENQDKNNIHNNINPSLSVTIIKNHVRKGIEKARELRLPKQVIDIIEQHHGDDVMQYFYFQAKQKDSSVNPGDYSYDYPRPSTKESAVVMLADTVEAACKSLDTPSATRLKEFIHTLIQKKIEAQQLSDCDLTLKDISKIEEDFIDILVGHYHARTKYPDQKEEQKTADAPADSDSTVQNAEKNIETDSSSENKERKESKESKIEQKELTEVKQEVEEQETSDAEQNEEKDLEKEKPESKAKNKNEETEPEKTTKKRGRRAKQ